MICVEENEKGEPLSFTASGQKVEVLKIEDFWCGSNYTYFKVLSKERDEWILKKERPHNRWSFVYYKKAEYPKCHPQHQIPENPARTLH